jgi:hypothetical protein
VFGAERCLFVSRLGEQVARAALHDAVEEFAGSID